jgi:hypothetical protein
MSDLMLPVFVAEGVNGFRRDIVFLTNQVGPDKKQDAHRDHPHHLNDFGILVRRLQNVSRKATSDL